MSENKDTIQKIDPDNLMCMICEYSCYKNDETIECEYEDEDGNINPNLMKNFDCDEFKFSPIDLIEVLVCIVKEMNNTGKPKDKNSIRKRK